MEFPGRQIALVLNGQREIKARFTAMEEQLAQTATRDLMRRILRSFEEQVEVAGIRTGLLRETLEVRIIATEARFEVLDVGRRQCGLAGFNGAR